MLHEIGVITTGFEPRRHYDPNTDCAWTIMASETWRIKVIFENMCIEWESYCQYDYLEVTICFLLFYLINKERLPDDR